LSKYIIFAAKKFIAMATITKPKKSKYTTEYITISYNTKNVNAMVLLDLLSKENGVKFCNYDGTLPSYSFKKSMIELQNKKTNKLKNTNNPLEEILQ